MFNLRRYFALASAAALVVVTVVLVTFYRQSAVDELVAAAETQNAALAQAFANSMWPRFSSYITSVPAADGEALRARPETREIRKFLKRLAAKLPVVKVKIFNRAGLTIYSSVPREIGADRSGRKGFIAATQTGKPASKLTFKNTFNSFDGRIENRNIVESYIPIKGGDGSIMGVFELYSDVTPLVDNVEHTTVKLVLGLLLTFGSLYGVLFLIVGRPDRILKKQYVDLQRSDERIKAKNTALENEVAERKRAEAALRESERALQARLTELEEAHRRLEWQGADLVRLAGDLRIARDEADAASRAKSQFLALMSHELRTPLNAIIGFSEIIRNESFGPVGTIQYRDYANDIHSSGQHLLELINDILDLSKVESGADELHEENTHVPTVVDAAFTLIKDRAAQGGIRLESELQDGLPMLRADQRKLKQILVNLLSNAMKFTEAGGQVTLKTWCRLDSGFVFQVIDTGIGIPPEKIPTVLSPFGQVDTEFSRKHEGTGLGLPLAKAFVERHGGSLDLQSEEGVGTTVTVRFPADRIALMPRLPGSPGAADKQAS
ncbi:MAG: sensor histidine kinase [Kiloniellaceae bacterium]